MTIPTHTRDKAHILPEQRAQGLLLSKQEHGAGSQLWPAAGGSQLLCTGPDSRLGTENHTKRLLLKLLRQHQQALTLPSCAFVTGTGDERSRGALRWGRAVPLGSPATGAQLPT